jgi:predicted ribosomally synthesized peptide with SipW-like signal peptide
MKRIGLLCLALVLALGALGVGYAAWTDVITINGSVSTGSVCLCITETGQDKPFTSDPCGSGILDANALYSSCVDGNPVFTDLEPAELKDVACTDVTWVSCDTLEVTVNNAYPYYAAGVDFNVCNCGTVPVKLWKVTIWDDNGNTATFYDDPAETCLDIDNDGEYDMIIDWGDSWGNQREPGHCYDLSFGFVFLQPLDQGLEDLHFYITMTAIQWDEYPGMGPMP